VHDGILHLLLGCMEFVGLGRTHLPQDHLCVLCVCRMEARCREVLQGNYSKAGDFRYVLYILKITLSIDHQV
jgi:hypothetical protein